MNSFKPWYFLPMDKNDLFEEISQRLASVLPMAETASAEAKAKLDAALKRGLADMDILTREEFAAQAAALAKAESRIDELEKTLAKLEAQIGNPLEPQQKPQP